MQRNIAVFGTFDNYNLSVCDALINSGYNVSVMVKNIDAMRSHFPPQINLVSGNNRYHNDLKKFLAQNDTIYLCYNKNINEYEDEYHEETDGLREIINASQTVGIKRIILCASLLQNYQGENGFKWWVFENKIKAVNYVRDCGIPFTIFYPSIFMESLIYWHKKGKKIQVYGTDLFPQYYISFKDYCRMLINSLTVAGTEDREYDVQGTDCHTTHEAAEILVQNYSKEKLHIKEISINWVKLLGIFSKKMRYNAKLMTAVNNYNEILNSEFTWRELGKPEISLKQFAQSIDA